VRHISAGGVMKGYVYVLSNPAMPGYFKIGRSIEGGRKRASTIYQTGVPEPFIVEFEVLVSDCVEAEREAHDSLDEYRENKNREFFKCDLPEAVAAVMSAAAYEIDYNLVYADSIPAVEACGEFSSILQEHPIYIANALRFLDSAAVADAVSRYKEWLDGRKTGRQKHLSRADGKTTLKLVRDSNSDFDEWEENKVPGEVCCGGCAEMVDAASPIDGVKYCEPCFHHMLLLKSKTEGAG